MSIRKLLIIILFVLPGFALAQAKLNREVVFVHFNDFYEIENRYGKGGLMALKQAIDRQKQDYPDAIVTFGGDLLSPSSYSALSKGQHMIEAMALVNVNVAVPGNHEFDFGLVNAIKQFGQSGFPWVNSNLDTDEPSLEKATVALYVHEVNGVKVGFMGIITPQLSQLSASQAKLQPANIIDSARQMVARLKMLQVDMIVALTHLNLEEDTTLAQQVPDIDLILGGHEHYPLSLTVNDTLIIKAGTNGEYLGMVRVAIDPSGHTRPAIQHWQLSATAETAPTANNTQTGADDSAINRYLQRYRLQIEQSQQKPLAKTLIPLDAREAVVRTRESGFANLVADALRLSLRTDIALINGGGIRSNRLYPAGFVLTENDILSALPFANRVGVVKLSGQQLLKVLEHGLADIENYGGRFPQVSGLAVEYAPASPSGQRIARVLIAGKPMVPGQFYTLASVDFLLHGGDGYESLQQAQMLVDTEAGDLLSNIVSTYLANLQQIETVPMGRMRALPEQLRGSQ